MKNLLLAFTAIFFSVLIFAQAPPDYVAHYFLNNDAIDVSGNNYNGTLTNTTATTDRFGNPNSATAFVAGSSFGQLPASLQNKMKNSFSFSFWFKTSINANSSSQWYGGNALFDAEVCGVTSDWGVALIDGGKACFGIGASDITIKSASNYNDGNWHFLSATRNQAAGTITLYVDGAQVASSSGTYTGELTAPPYIGLGRNPCDANLRYTGSLDEVIVYDRELSPAEIANLYNFSSSGTLPLQWLAFNGIVNKHSILLNWKTGTVVNNDHFEIEESFNDQSFSRVGTVNSNDNTMSYSFSIDNVPDGIHYYRIKQVDIDGKYSWSKTIQLTVKKEIAGFHLLTNPVTNELTIMNPGLELLKQIIVTDITGKIIRVNRVNSFSSSFKSGILSLKAGYYFLLLTTKQGNFTLPFVKQ